MTAARRPGPGRALAALVLLLGVASPWAGQGVSQAAAAEGDRTLRLGVLQPVDSLNPFATKLVVGYEAMGLNYQQLVGFGSELEPIPDFAISWERAADGHSWTFKFRPDMRWSDGQPATSEDACFSWQLGLDAIEADGAIGLGYLEPGLRKARVSKVECPDPTTMIVTTDDGSSRILQTSMPILPEHVWADYTYDRIGEPELFVPPPDDSGLVGSGPYQAVEWKPDEFVRFKRNPNYAERHGFEDEIVMRYFESSEAMVEALKSGAIDYARTVSPHQFAALSGEPRIETVNGAANGWVELGFNTYGTGTGKTIKGGGPSTTALRDPRFRDALGYAIDNETLIRDILGGYGTIGTTQIPPVLKAWHVEPAAIRSFDLDAARQKLDAAGYPLGADGIRRDKEGKPIRLRLVMPDYDPNFAKVASFIVDWFGQVGVRVTAKAYPEDDLIALMLPPEYGDPLKYRANYDLFVWTWYWGPDPSDPLQLFTCDQIGSSSDSLWCDPAYDALYEQQLVAPDDTTRLAIVTQMQQLWYDAAPYHILYYDDNLHAYRMDRFAGWQNQPSNGTPLFSYSVLGETLLTDATAAASPSAAATARATPAIVSPAASAAPADEGVGAISDRTPILIAIVGLVIAVAIGTALLRRRAETAAEAADVGASAGDAEGVDGRPDAT